MRFKKHPIRNWIWWLFPILEKKAMDRLERHALHIEQGEEIPIYQILKIDDRHFPPADQLNQRQLRSKLRRLIRIMNKHRFIFMMEEKIPDVLAYRYLTEKFIHSKSTTMPGKWFSPVTGCEFWCENCLIADYCDIKDEMMDEGEQGQSRPDPPDSV